MSDRKRPKLKWDHDSHETKMQSLGAALASVPKNGNLDDYREARLLHRLCVELSSYVTEEEWGRALAEVQRGLADLDARVQKILEARALASESTSTAADEGAQAAARSQNKEPD